MTDSRTRFDEIADELASAGPVSIGKLFGHPTLKADGKAFGCLFGDALALKLEGAAHAEALALPGARLFDPSGKQRPMREWVEIPAAHAGRWPGLALAALRYAGH
jgi:TfoX/Sxy family transcriptional regulator of competence genes